MQVVFVQPLMNLMRPLRRFDQIAYCVDCYYTLHCGVLSAMTSVFTALQKAIRERYRPIYYYRLLHSSQSWITESQELCRP
jgi:hypothetical protein